MRPGRIPTYPFLAAVYPLLALVAENFEESIHARDLIGLLALSLGLSGIAWFMAGFVRRDPGPRALLTLLGVLSMLWYGPVADVFGRALGLVQSDRSHWLLPVWLVLSSALALYVARSRSSFAMLTSYLNAAVALLLVFLGAKVLFGQLAGPHELVGLPLPETAHVAETGARPDIYFIVLDKYASGGSLRKNLDFDIGSFEEGLRSRGFFVPRQSRTNYVHTHLSLASMLNWTHLDEVAREMGPSSRDRSVTYAMIENNRAWRYLQARGYEFVFFPSAYPATPSNRYADRQLPRPFRSTTNMQLAWMIQTPLPALVTWICLAVGCDVREDRRFPYVPESAELVQWKFDRLARLARETGPKFVLAHLLVPHEPYMFESDCSVLDPFWPWGDTGKMEPLVREGYTRQISCVNYMLLDLVDALLRDSSEPPVIVLQSDHGHGRLTLDPVHNHTIPLDRLRPSQIEERVEVFAAYYVPREGPPDFYDGITPVNVLPVVLNRLFVDSIPLLEDATYWSEPHRPFDLSRLRRFEVDG